MHDHTTANEIVTLVKREFQKLERVDMLSPAQKEKIRREFTLQRLQNVAQLPGMEGFEAIDRDRLPKSHHDFQSFVNQSASVDSSATNDIMVNWHLPISLKLILLPDVLT